MNASPLFVIDGLPVLLIAHLMNTQFGIPIPPALLRLTQRFLMCSNRMSSQSTPQSVWLPSVS